LTAAPVITSLIVATIRDGELNRHLPDSPGSHAAAAELKRGVPEVLDQVWKVEIRSRFSARREAAPARRRSSQPQRLLK